MASISACGSSQDEDFNPRNARAGFAVTQKDTGAEAGALFIVPGTGLTTTVGIDSVVVIGPLGTRTTLNVEKNSFGASYYRIDLPGSLQLNATYEFEVNLEEGAPVRNSITTPTASLQITSPTPPVSLAKNAYLDVDWENPTSSSNTIDIAIRKSMDYLFTVIGTGGVKAKDTGEFRGLQEDIEVRDAMEDNDQWTGSGYLILNRKTESGVNGFAAFSYILAAIVDGIDVTITQ